MRFPYYSHIAIRERYENHIGMLSGKFRDVFGMWMAIKNGTNWQVKNDTLAKNGKTNASSFALCLKAPKGNTKIAMAA